MTPVIQHFAKLQTIFDNLNMQNIITTPTKTTIDSSTLIVTTRRNLISSTGVFPLGISDHDLIYARGQIILLYLYLHLVIYSNLIVTEGQSSGMQSHRKTLILLLSHVELLALD